MSIELNHTIVHVKDRWAASRDVGQVLGLPEATAYGPFAELKLDNGASLDFMDTEGEIPGQHYAFLVSEEDFDVILGRLQDEGREWWADPYRRQRARDQPWRRWPWPLLGWPRRALAGDHHPPLRQRRLTSGSGEDLLAQLREPVESAGHVPLQTTHGVVQLR